MLLVLAMLMTMFAGLGVASAADMYSVASVPAVEKGINNKLGTIVVTAYNFETGTDAGFFVKLPANFVINKIGTTSIDSSIVGDAVTVNPFKGDNVSATVYSTGQENRVKVVVAATADVEELKFNLPITAKAPSTVPSEVKASIAKEPGSVFTDASLVIGTSSAASVEAIANDSITITSDAVVKISIRSNTDSSLDKLNFKLPAGFTWKDATMTKGSDVVNATLADQERTAKFTFADGNKGIWSFEGTVDVDESRAKFGDVVVSLSGSGVKPSNITVGTYADFGVEVSASDAPQVLAGRTDVEVADIEFKELAAGSLVNGRTVYLTLPSGTRWVSNVNDELVMEDLEVTGSITNVESDVTVYSNKTGMAKIAIKNAAMDSKGKLVIEAPQIEIAPDFVGDINVEITGSAGISETVKVAEVVAPVTVEADLTDVKIGLQAQAGGNIVITEVEAEALNATDKNGDDAFLTLTAPMNVQWAKVPTVKVVEGDLEIGTVTRHDSNRQLSIRIKETSTVASKIEISDVAWTVDRTVPEGDMKVSVAGNSVVEAAFTNRTSVTSFVAAKVVTPAPGATLGNGEFRIGSNIYYVGGVAKVMDVAPYIKGDRTYVPMRYAAEIIGAEVVWDDAARTVTLTKGDDVVVFTIGSTTYTVNGEAMTADVAPEIANDRTMLPARYVAEAFGAVVGWDAGTQTVLIQK